MPRASDARVRGAMRERGGGHAPPVAPPGRPTGAAAAAAAARVLAPDDAPGPTHVGAAAGGGEGARRGSSSSSSELNLGASSRASFAEAPRGGAIGARGRRRAKSRSLSSSSDSVKSAGVSVLGEHPPAELSLRGAHFEVRSTFLGDDFVPFQKLGARITVKMAMIEEDFEKEVKVVVLGNGCVGKSSMIRRYCMVRTRTAKASGGLWRRRGGSTASAKTSA